MTTYVARFQPEVWVNDYAMTVSIERPDSWDATEFCEEADREWLTRTLERGCDHDDILRLDPNAPEWVRNWPGPFETYLEVVA